ncbi:MAG: HigA family addiction module antidote protein [Victivallaceae bacterium]|nr:HigA family addiction module antidote protein [Victivallaceae bacterium]
MGAYERVLDVTQLAVCPSHPGEILKEFYLSELAISITDFAKDIGVSRKAISAIVNGHKSVTPEMAMRLSKAMRTTPQLWLNLQANHDLWHLAHERKEVFAKIKPLELAIA